MLSVALSAPAAQIPATTSAAPSPPRSWLADDPPFTFAFDVVVLTSTRTALLRLVLASVARHVGPAARAVHVWIDRPAPKEVDAVERRRRKAGGKPLPPGVSAENATFAATHAALAPFRGSLPLRVLAFERHQGTRAVWLTALSREEPTLVLEDDVVVRRRNLRLARQMLGARRCALSPIRRDCVCSGAARRGAVGGARARADGRAAADPRRLVPGADHDRQDRKPRRRPATSRRPARPRLSASNWRGSGLPAAAAPAEDELPVCAGGVTRVCAVAAPSAHVIGGAPPPLPPPPARLTTS